MSGVSHPEGTPLIKKLGIKTGQTVLILNAPRNYRETLGPLPRAVKEVSELRNDLDSIQIFTDNAPQLDAEFPRLKEALAKSGMLWVCRPKRASKVDTDLDQGVVMDIGLRNGLVDVKVASIDDTWSGLKFVYRLKDRG